MHGVHGIPGVLGGAFLRVAPSPAQVDGKRLLPRQIRAANCEVYKLDIRRTKKPDDAAFLRSVLLNAKACPTDRISRISEGKARPSARS